MKFDLTKVVVDLQNKPLKNSDGTEGTYRDIISLSLQANDPRDQIPETAEQKSRCFEILIKIFSAKEVELTATQIALILEKAGKFAPVIAFGRLKELLEPEVKDTPA